MLLRVGSQFAAEPGAAWGSISKPPNRRRRLQPAQTQRLLGNRLTWARGPAKTTNVTAWLGRLRRGGQSRSCKHLLFKQSVLPWLVENFICRRIPSGRRRGGRGGSARAPGSHPSPAANPGQRAPERHPARARGSSPRVTGRRRRTARRQ